MENIQELEMLSEEVTFKSRTNLILERSRWKDILELPFIHQILQRYYVILSNGRVFGWVDAFAPNREELLIKKVEPLAKRNKEYDVYFQGKTTNVKIPKHEKKEKNAGSKPAGGPTGLGVPTAFSASAPAI